ncbi:RimK family alpha-L-glutamate ligase [Candidatus Woesebacteria bacterium]|nr:MAG: RimK family alpha-L-glutamate ligase [Candidatus Woesebacteria bacterium]
MKVKLITTLQSIEMQRLKDETCAMGHECDLVDLSKFTFSIRDTKLSIDNLGNPNPDVVVVKGVTVNKAPIVALIHDYRKRGIKVFDNNYCEHQYTINKVTDLIKLSLNNVPIPDTFHCHDFDEFYRACEIVGYPAIVKLVGAGKGAGVFKADNKERLAEIISNAQNDMLKSASRFIVQQYIPYEHDLRVLIIGEKLFVMKRIPGEGEFRANFSLGGSVETFELDDEGKELAKRGLAAVDMSVAGVDLLITKDNKRYVLEVNHTPGFVGMEKATGENIARIYMEHAIGNAY